MARRQITQLLARSAVRWRPMCDRLRINRARTGEKYSARTSMVRQRTAATRSQRVGEGASIAYVGAKNISPVPMRRVVKFGVRHDLWRGDV